MIPEFAGDLFVHLIQAFAVVRVGAAPDRFPAPQFNFQKPVGVGERLSCEARDVGLTLLKYSFSLLKGCDSTGGDDWRAETGLVDGALDGCDYGDAPRERAARI